MALLEYQAAECGLSVCSALFPTGVLIGAGTREMETSS